MGDIRRPRSSLSPEGTGITSANTAVLIDLAMDDDAEVTANHLFSKPTLPWMTCVMGCSPVTETMQVRLLNCFHIICSDSCLAKLRHSATTNGKALACLQCRAEIQSDELDNKIIPADIFERQKEYSEVELRCENCVHDRPAVAFCQDCPALLCFPCKSNHKDFRSTHNHIIRESLQEVRAERMESLKAEDNRCKTHGELYTQFCVTCNEKACSKCEKHSNHAKFDVEEERTKLRAKIEPTKFLMRQCDLAIKELLRKQNETRTEKWKTIESQIYQRLIQTILLVIDRYNYLLHQTKSLMKTQISTLSKKCEYAQHNKNKLDRFLSTLEDIHTNRADVTSGKFIRATGNCEQWFAEVSYEFLDGFDNFVEKDWDFKLSPATGWYIGEVDYVRTAKASSPPLKTYPGVKRKHEATKDKNSKLCSEKVNLPQSKLPESNEMMPVQQLEVSCVRLNNKSSTAEKVVPTTSAALNAGDDDDEEDNVSELPEGEDPNEGDFMAVEDDTIDTPKPDVKKFRVAGRKTSYCLNYRLNSKGELERVSDEEAGKSPTESNIQEGKYNLRSKSAPVTPAASDDEGENASLEVRRALTGSANALVGSGKRRVIRKTFSDYHGAAKPLSFLKRRRISESSTARSNNGYQTEGESPSETGAVERKSMRPRKLYL